MAPAALAATQGLDHATPVDQAVPQRRPARRHHLARWPAYHRARKTADRIKEEWAAELHGRQLGKIAVFSNNVKFQPVAQAAKDAQLVEQLGLSGKMVCSRSTCRPIWSASATRRATTTSSSFNQLYYCAVPAEVFRGDRTMPRRRARADQRARPQLRHRIRSRQSAAHGHRDAWSRARPRRCAAASRRRTKARKRLNLGKVEGGESPYLQHQDYSLAALAKRDASDDPFGTAAPASPRLLQRTMRRGRRRKRCCLHRRLAPQVS